MIFDHILNFDAEVIFIVYDYYLAPYFTLWHMIEYEK